MTTDQFRCPKAAVDVHALSMEGDLDPALQGVDREQGPVPVQGVVPVPDKIQLGTTELRFDPLVLIREDGLVPGYDRAQDRLGHLGAQAEALADQVIQFTVQRADAQVVELVDIVRDQVTGSAVGMHGIDQELCVRRIWKDLEFCGESLFHGYIIPQEQAKRNMCLYLIQFVIIFDNFMN